MEEKKERGSRLDNITGHLMVWLGLIFLICGVLVVRDFFYLTKPKTDGVIININRERHNPLYYDNMDSRGYRYQVTVQYSVNGREYVGTTTGTGRLAYSVGYYKAGDKVRIAYNRTNPGKRSSLVIRKGWRPKATIGGLLGSGAAILLLLQINRTVWKRQQSAEPDQAVS